MLVDDINTRTGIHYFLKRVLAEFHMAFRANGYK